MTSPKAPAPSARPRSERIKVRTRSQKLIVPLSSVASDGWNNLDDADESPRVWDPAYAAARLLLHRAFAAAGTTTAEAGRDGTVCIVVLPSSAWSEVTQQAWRLTVRNGQPWLEGQREHLWKDGFWVPWTPLEQPQHAERRDAAEAFVRSVGNGRHCVGYTAEPSWLPPDLLHGADYRLTLPLPTGGDIANLMIHLFGSQPTVTLSDEQAVLLTPRLLRLARRPAQDSADYMARLLDLLERERAETATAPTKVTSVREEPTLARMHGMDAAVAWGRTLARDLADLRAGAIPWADVDPGCLLSGPPGCGKTLFARALAATCGVELVTGSYSQWLGTGDGHQGALLKAMRETFAQARARAPSILFIDEVDSFPNRATLTHHYADWQIQMVNALLAEVDGVEDRDGVVLLAACNHPEKLDPALVRSGRLDRHIRIDLPEPQALERILLEHLSGELPGVPLSGVALAAAGSSGADCERFVRGARRRARGTGQPMALADLVAEISGTDEGPEAELWIGAVHKAGHALASCEWFPGSLEAVTLRGVGAKTGRTVVRRGGGLFRSSDVRVRLAELLAGRAAEEVVFGCPSSGAGGGSTSDLAAATLFATLARTSLGLDAATGMVWSGLPTQTTLPSILAADPTLSTGVRIALDEAYGEALGLIRRRRVAVEAVADALMAKRALDGDEVAAIVAQHPGDAKHVP